MWRYAAWRRIGLVASFVWLGGVVICSALVRNFDLVKPYTSDLGPAAVMAVGGMIVIVVVCLGVPWIASAMRQRSG